jgi:Putative prokaryotic signal transducing protein
MGGPADGFVRLLAAPDAVEAELARDLLRSAGIPSLLHGQDRDLAELGQAIHMRISRPDVYVPAAELERARNVLAEAWDESALTDELAMSTPRAETPASSARPRPTWFFRGLFVAAIVIAIVVSYRKLVA